MHRASLPGLPGSSGVADAFAHLRRYCPDGRANSADGDAFLAIRLLTVARR